MSVDSNLNKKDKRRPSLSLAMMVKDEERFLEDALLSARDWVDEMVVVDTGSVDRTVEIAQDLGAKVSHFPWPNDFSKARNETIRRSSGDWIAILDADERFRGAHPQRVRDLMTRTEHWPYQGILLNVVNQRLDGTTTHAFFSPRIFPRHPDVGYFGRIHNCFGSISHGEGKDFNLTKCLGLEIVHLGYDKEIYLEKGKEQRNLNLLEAAVREEPMVDRYRFYLGREYVSLNRFEEGLTLLRSVLALPKVEPMCRRETRVAILQALQNSQASFDEFLLEAISVLEESPREADAWYLLALAYSNQGLKAESIEALEQGLSFIDDLDVNLQASRLSGERSRAELVLADHYRLKPQPDLDKAAEWYHHSWSHLSIGDEGWVDVTCKILGWSIESEDHELLKEVMVCLSEHLQEVRLCQAFLLGLNAIKRLHSNHFALKLLKKAMNTQPNLRQDPNFVQILRELR